MKFLSLSYIAFLFVVFPSMSFAGMVSGTGAGAEPLSSVDLTTKYDYHECTLCNTGFYNGGITSSSPSWAQTTSDSGDFFDNTATSAGNKKN